jgi:hypothetical protein
LLRKHAPSLAVRAISQATRQAKERSGEPASPTRRARALANLCRN